MCLDIVAQRYIYRLQLIPDCVVSDLASTLSEVWVAQLVDKLQIDLSANAHCDIEPNQHHSYHTGELPSGRSLCVC